MMDEPKAPTNVHIINKPSTTDEINKGLSRAGCRKKNQSESQLKDSTR